MSHKNFVLDRVRGESSSSSREREKVVVVVTFLLFLCVCVCIDVATIRQSWITISDNRIKERESQCLKNEIKNFDIY